jgi:hypothetical protein
MLSEKELKCCDSLLTQGENKMKLKYIAGMVCVVTLASGCASVPMESKERSSHAKAFNPPSDGKAGLYIYRSLGVGTALKKDIWVDGKCVGESAPNVFFYEEVAGNEEHKLSTESEFSPNDLLLKTDSGKNYFVKQYIKMGVFVGGANLEMVDEVMGKQDISGLELAVKGSCSS